MKEIVTTIFSILLLSYNISIGKGTAPKVIHVYLALCDNKNQGIVPVPERFGNGDNPHGNLYWGAGAGLKTFFKRSKEWKLIKSEKKINHYVLERCIFKYKTKNIYMVADAYRGKNIYRAVNDFFYSAAGRRKQVVSVKNKIIYAGGNAQLHVYVGHNGLMDFSIQAFPGATDGRYREVIIISCASKPYFKKAIKKAGAYPLVWSTGLLAAEAYTLKGALDGWINNERPQSIRRRAARAYHQYQKCGMKRALRLFVSGW